MKQFFFAVALVALTASVGFSDDAPAPTPVTSGATPVVMGSTSPTYTMPAQPMRRGLFARLRSRNNRMMSSSTPMMTTTPMSATPMPGAPTPMPMPSVKTAGTPTTMAMPMSGTVVQATGNLPAGMYTTTDGTVVQVGGTMTRPARLGLLARLRSR
jgi:hypothetical protein